MDQRGESQGTVIEITDIFGQVVATLELRGYSTVWVTEGVKPGGED